MSITTDKFIQAMAVEHEQPTSTYDSLRPLVDNALATTEGGITEIELQDLIHGSGESGPSAEVQSKYPLLNAVSLTPYMAADEHEDDDETDEDAEDEADDAEADEDEDDVEAGDDNETDED